MASIVGITGDYERQSLWVEKKIAPTVVRLHINIVCGWVTLFMIFGSGTFKIVEVVWCVYVVV